MKLTDQMQQLYQHDFASFTRFAFNELHPYAGYDHNWHIDVLAHYLAEVERGNIKRLIINMPPRALKSHCASVALPAYFLGRNPNKKMLYLHAGADLGRELQASTQDLMQSRRYRALFPAAVMQPGKNKLSMSHGGHRQFQKMSGRLTGLGADVIVIDDPIGAMEAQITSERDMVNQCFDANILQRLDNKKTGAIIVVMQRLHENDLTGHLLEKHGDWVHLNLPAVALEDESWQIDNGKIHRRKKGEVLHPARESRNQLIKTLISIGGYPFAYQYLQGAYKPHFGEDGKGALWCTHLRDGQFYDARIHPADRATGFYKYNEIDLILPRVFGIGEDPYPSDVRRMTSEEWSIVAQIARDRMFEYQKRDL